MERVNEARHGMPRRINLLLDKIYTDASNPGSFSSVAKLWRLAKQKDPAITLQQVREYLSKQESYTLHGPSVPKKYPRTPVYVARHHLLLAADLGDMQTLKQYNDGYSYILLILD